MTETSLDRVINHVGYLLNSSDPETELHKMVTLEMTTNPRYRDLEYVEIMHIVIMRLVEFYNDAQLEDLWYDYLDSDDQHNKAA